MAKTTKPTGKLAGKSVALVGKFGYRDNHRKQHARIVTRAGGKVVDAAKSVPDYLFVGEGRGGKPPSDVARLQKKSPAIEVLSVPEFLELLLPDRDQVLSMIRSRGKEKEGFWSDLEHSFLYTKATIDLSKVDLRNADLNGAHFDGILLDGSDLRGAKVRYAEFGNLEKVDFDGCDGEDTCLRNLKICTFREAHLKEAWLFYEDSQTMEKCDFSGANLTAARLEDGKAIDCKFTGADLSDAELEKSTFERTDFSRANLTRIHATEAKFKNSNFAKANLERADLRKASLQGADLRNANLRRAVLSDADVSGANIAGADFQDAVLTGTNLKGLDLSKAKNLTAPVVRVAGPKLKELAAAAAGTKHFKTSAEVELGKDEFAELELSAFGKSVWAHSVYCRDGIRAFDRITATSLAQALLKLADRWPRATLRLDSVTVKGAKKVRGSKLKDLAMAAWSETFGAAPQSPEELKKQRDAQQTEALRERDELMKKVRAKGTKAWNNIDRRLRDRFDLCGVDLSKTPLNKIDLFNHKLHRANLTGASLVEADLWAVELVDAVLTGANLERADLQRCVLNGANLQNANLTGANLSNARLLGTDFSGATLKDADLSQAQFDHKTIFPKGFQPDHKMVWKGDGPRPGTKLKAAKAGSLDFDTFLKRMGEKIETVRLQKAGSMLKAERFQLFADAKADSLLGIVKSQSSKDLVYSCRLTSDGSFGCCTQNLNACGGLRGALCKHLLVLIIGLAKAGQLDSATVDHWINLSQGQKPAIDEDSMSATFLRFKGAEAGEVDWRPTETIPEDFYTM